ncbi:MAG TPA: hypothetical protein VE631_01805 [Alphaproteobacteria bacterium]|nr:hypothetical protein [Alphaproteobacteria bacterium]
MQDLGSAFGAVGGVGGLLLLVFALLFGAIWMVMPFVVLAMNRRLGQTVEELRHQNELLAHWLELKGGPPPEPRPAEARRPRLVRQAPPAESSPEATADAAAKPSPRPREARVEPHL